jgi:hypothetical protein
MATKRWYPSKKRQAIVKNISRSSSSVVDRDALRKVVVLKWCVGAVGAGSVPCGAAGSAHFGVFRLGERRVPSRG